MEQLDYIQKNLRIQIFNLQFQIIFYMQVRLGIQNKQGATQILNTLEFKDGLPQSYLKLNDNAIHTNKFNAIDSFPKLMLSYVMRIGNLYLIICILIVVCFPQLSPYNISIYIFPLLTSLILLVIKQLFIDRYRIAHDKVINQQKTKLCKQQIQQIKWGTLKVGDVIYLKQGELVPADIILLDSQQFKNRQAMTYVDTSKITGCTTIDKKKAAYLTQLQYRGIQKNNWSHYRHVLNGKLIYESKNKNYEKFNGYLKLVKDPKIEHLTIQNLILRGSIIKTSIWIFGLVVYAGMDTKIMQRQNTSILNDKKNILLRSSEKIIFGIIGVNLLIGLIFTLLHIIMETEYTFFWTFFYYFLKFSVSIPFFIYIFIDVISFLLKIKTEKINDIKVNNPNCIQQIGNLDYVFFSKNGVISTGQYVIHDIMTPSCIYKIQQIQQQKKIRTSKRTGYRQTRQIKLSKHSLGSLSLSQRPLQLLINPNMQTNNNVALGSCSQSEKFEIDDNPISLNNDQNPPIINQYIQFEPLVLDKFKLFNNVTLKQQQSINSLLAMVLCHQSKFIYNYKKQQFVGISHNPTEQLLIKFGKTLGLNYQCYVDTEKQNFINIQFLNTNQKISYQIIGVHSFKNTQERLAIVYKDEKQSHIVCKGNPQNMLKVIKFVNDQQRIKIENKIAQYKIQGIQPLIYGKKRLYPDQLLTYENDYMSVKLALNTTDKEIKQFTQKYEKQLEFVCMVGIKDQLSANSKKLVCHLKKQNIKFGILSSDTADTVLNVGKKLVQESYQDKIEYIHLDQQTKQLTKYQISEILAIIKSKSNLKFVVVINQKTAQLIIQENDFRSHFLYIFYKSTSIIGYNLDPETLGKLTQIIKQNSPFIHTIMAVGYGFYNLQMLNEADISIGMGQIQGDMNVNQLDQILNLLKKGSEFFTIGMCLINQVLYRYLSLNILLITYEIIGYRKILAIINDQTIWLIANIFPMVEVCITFILKLKENKEYQKTPYIHNQIIKKNIIRQFFLLIFIESFFHSIIIVLSIYFILPNCKYNINYLYGNQTENTVLLLLIITIALFRFLIFEHKLINILQMFIIIFVTYSTYVISIFMCGVFSQQNKINQFFLMFLSYDCIIMIINTLMCNLSITFFIRRIVKEIFFIQNHNGKQSLLKNLEIFNENQHKEVIKYQFKDAQNIDYNMIQIMQYFQINHNQIKFDKLYEFKDPVLQIKYQFQNLTENISTITKISIILNVCFFFMIIASFSNSNWKLTSVQSIYSIINFLICTIITTISIVFKKFFEKYHFHLVLLFFSFLEIAIITYELNYSKKQKIIWLSLISILITNRYEIKKVYVLILLSILFLCNLVVIILYKKQTILIQISELLLFTLLTLINIKALFDQSFQKKSHFLNEQTFKTESEHTQDILSLLVPKFIHKYIQDGQYKLQQAQNDVSILFCYVCNFDTIVKEEGKNVVHLMDQLFRQFDQLCHNHAVQKIQTVGMTYMAATGITACEQEFQNYLTRKNPVERLLKMAIVMIEKAKGIMYGKNKDKKVKIKIGIHTGKVIIGVIGFHKPQFSLIGDTVNTTSRHCSTAKQGEIILSKTSFKKLKYRNQFFEKGYAQMKGLGQIQIYKWRVLKKNQNVEEVEKNKRFKDAVRKVIQQLKDNNKIKYITVTQMIRNLFENKIYKIRNTEKINSGRTITEKFLEMDRIKQNNQPSIMQISYQNQLSVNWILDIQKNRQDFYEFIKKKTYKSGEQLFKIFAFTSFFEIIITIINNFNFIYFFFEILGFFLLISCVYIYKKAFDNFYYKSFIIISIIYIPLLVGIYLLIKPYTNCSEFQFVYLLISITITSRFQLISFKEYIILTILSYIPTFAILVICNPAFNIGHFIQSISYIMILFLNKYLKMNSNYTMYNSIQYNQKKRRQQEGLVSQLLPKHAFLKLRNQNLSNKIQLTDQIEGATLLFADIKGFTSYSNKNTPQDVVNMLRKLFQQFDKTCLKYNVYKVYTIGDCYVVLGFTNTFQRDVLQQAKNVVNMGLAMVDIVHSVRQQIQFPELDMRIGIHTGTIIGGIIGTDIVRYDIYGRDVMIANKFEQYGKTGCVHISSATKSILDTDLKNTFKMVPHGSVKIQKLNVELSGYLINRKKFEI